MARQTCPLCKQQFKDLEKHILLHIETCQKEERAWLELGNTAKKVYRRLFNKEP